MQRRRADLARLEIAPPLTARRPLQGWLGWVLLSLLAHLLLSPLGRSRAPTRRLVVERESALTEIPINIASETQPAGAPEPPPPKPLPREARERHEPKPASARAAPTPPTAPAPDERSEPALPLPKPESAPDAGVRDAGAPDTAASAAHPGRELPDAALSADAGAPTPSIADPVAANGALRSVAADAYVRVQLDVDKLRETRVAARVAQLLSSVSAWQGLFGPRALDPARDVDRVLIIGPQLRRSAAAIAVMQRHPRDAEPAPPAARPASPDAGSSETGITTATPPLRAAGHLVVEPSPDVLVVGLNADLPNPRGIDASLSLPGIPGGAVMLGYAAMPWRSLRVFDYRAPRLLKWVRLQMIVNSDAGAEIALEAEDENATLAEKHAAELSDAVRALSPQDLGFPPNFPLSIPERVAESIEFSAAGPFVRARIVLSEAQLNALLELLRTWVSDAAEGPPAASASAVSPAVAPSASTRR